MTGVNSTCHYCDPEVNFTDMEILTTQNEDVMCEQCRFTKILCKELFFEILDRGLLKL